MTTATPQIPAVKCAHEPYHGRWVHCDAQFVGGRAVIAADPASARLAALEQQVRELVEALRYIVACCSMEGPAGTTAYLISDARMSAAKAALAKVTAESEAE